MIIIIRHGETEWNVKKIKQGRLNSPLTNIGIKQALNLKNQLQKFVQEHKIDSLDVFHSPSKRVRDFMDIAILGSELDLDNFYSSDNLQEHSFGDWEGLTEKQIKLKYPYELEKREINFWKYQCPNGESYEILYRRVKSFSDKYLSNYIVNKHCLVFTHEMVSKVLRGYFLSMKEEEILKLSHPQDHFFYFEGKKLTPFKFY